MSHPTTPNWTSYLTESAVWSGTDSAPHYLHAFDDSGTALCNSRIRPWNHRENGSYFRPLTAFTHLPLYRVHDRCRTKAQALADAHPDAQQRAAEQAQHDAEQAEAKRQEQHHIAASLYAEVHPAAERLVTSLQENADTTAQERGTGFTPAQVWGQIGWDPGALYGQGDGETNDAIREALGEAWDHINRRAQAGELNFEDEWTDLVTAARDVLAPAYTQPGPVSLDKTPASWQVLWHTKSPLTGERWADFPVHSVVRTEQLRAGHDWDVIQRRLTEQGLSRYGFPAHGDYPPARSAAHALGMAREQWQTQGPHAAWFELANEIASD